MTRLLILGATGNLASLVVAHLAGLRDFQLRLTSSRPEGVERLKAEHPGAEVVQADWLDRESMLRAFDDVDRALIVSNDLLTDETVATPNIIAGAQSSKHLELLVRIIGAAPQLPEGAMTDEWRATGVGTAQRSISMPLFAASGLPITYVNAAGSLALNLLWKAGEVKASRRLLHPAYLAGPQLWVAEQDVAEVTARVLIEGPGKHAGQEYVLTGAERYTIGQVADLLSDAVGERVTWVDSDAGLRAALGPYAERLITALKCEQPHNFHVPIADTVKAVVGRLQTTLPEYIAKHRDAFV